MQSLAQAQAASLPQSPTGQRPPIVDSPRPPLTRRRAAFLVLQNPQKLKLDEAQLVQRLANHPHLALTLNLAQEFAQLMRHRQSERFDPWLERTERSNLPRFVRFARSLRDDYDTVKAGLTFTTSNEQVEGQINRLKMLKRQMCGRAGIELLERRFLLAR